MGDWCDRCKVRHPNPQCGFKSASDLDEERSRAIQGASDAAGASAAAMRHLARSMERLTDTMERLIRIAELSDSGGSPHREGKGDA